MNLKPKLSLNKHPKYSENLSLVGAMNIKLSHDGTCLTNEESITENEYITQCINNELSGEDYKIVGIIPCNSELILLVVTYVEPDYINIFRYHEKTINHARSMKLVYDKLKYHGGKIKGAFTYNVENSLILSIAEYDTNIDVPLRTINLGNYDDDSISNDHELDDTKLSIAPEVRIPNIGNIEYVKGNAYKGWYHLFIRFKINSVDYTQWFSFGSPIYVDNIEQFNIIRYCFNNENGLRYPKDDYNILFGGNSSSVNNGFVTGCSDYFSDTKDIANETFKVDIRFSNVNYDIYQIGIVCVSKSYTKAFQTYDIIKQSNTESYSFNSNNVFEASVNEFIIDNFNYYNVRNILNYKNRLYIANYKEHSANDNHISQEDIDRIKVSLVTSVIDDASVVYDVGIENYKELSNQYDSYIAPKIYVKDYLNIDKNINIKVTAYNGDTISSEQTDIAGNIYLTTRMYTDDMNYIDGGPIGNLIVVINNRTIYADKIILKPLNTDAKEITIDSVKHFLVTAGRYINTNTGFNNRKLYSTLIPGEVYNFFIHFVDKYGHATNGYRISNNRKVVVGSYDDEVIPVKFWYKDDFVYAGIPIDNNVCVDGRLNLNNVIFCSTLDNDQLLNEITGIDIANVFREEFSNFNDVKFNNVKWYQIIDYDDDFGIYINNNNDRLFKVPFGVSFRDTNNVYKHIWYRSTFSNVIIPDGYVGFYISYEKFESINKVTGLLVRSDFRSNIKYVESSNEQKSNNMMFYSSQFDVADDFKLDYNIMRIEAINCFDEEDLTDYDILYRNITFKYPHNFNKPQINSINLHTYYPIPKYKLVIADTVKDNRMGLGTALQLEDSYNLFPDYGERPRSTTTIFPPAYTEKVVQYRVSLLNTTRDLYMSNEKTLIRCSDIVYGVNFNMADILNGHYTYDGVLIYNNDGIVFNETDNIVYKFNGVKYYQTTGTEYFHTYRNMIPFVNYVQFPVCTNSFYESKSFKSSPKGILYLIKPKDDINEAYFAAGSMVTPMNTIDLFENKQIDYDTSVIKTYSNYREDIVNVEDYTKTIRRSNIIQDESRVNAWRIFPVEGYKNITENKGKITNLVGLGTVLLVHTEHSLFMFDVDNVMKTDNKEVQLMQPDVFEVEYKEVFTSELGYGGLQDDKSYITGEFGYIFYNNDFGRFYQFDNGELNIIDIDIIQWLKKYKLYNVRIGNDKDNSRLLIKANYNISGNTKTVTLSYNYEVKAFISLHSYIFADVYNTKSNLYLLDSNNTGIHQFAKDHYGYVNKTPVNSSLSLIINEAVDSVKYLELITYKLFKYAASTESDYTYLPVEEELKPYSGHWLRVFNNQINTGLMDIYISQEQSKNVYNNYSKPYWDLGNWNFSYLRDNIANYNTYGDSFNMSRLFGNYFIVEFSFDNKDANRIEFEELKYRIVKPYGK